MRYLKITTGYVVQVFDSEKSKFVNQNFVAGEVEWETDDGLIDDEPDEALDAYLPFDMKQPEI